MPAVLLALRATVRIRAASGEREAPLADVLVGPFTTSVAPQELVTEIGVPLPARGSGSAYASVEHPASGFALVGAAALSGPGGETVSLTGVGTTPFVLADGDPGAAIHGAEIFGDRFAPERYRRELAATLAERALARARERAKEDL
jgi:carbon-monoxide dehydrogenase medium subunit